MKFITRKTISILFFVFFLLGSAAVAQSEQLEKEHIQLLNPSIFKCGANIPWDQMSEWKGVSGKCGNGLLYTVIGKVDAVENGYIKAKIKVSEDKNNGEWAPFNGEAQNIINNQFEVQFCITTRSSTRSLWFQAYSKDGVKVGSRCTITLVGLQLED
jgi:hypothetical protein